mgnify:CR=1 FL=1
MPQRAHRRQVDDARLVGADLGLGSGSSERGPPGILTDTDAAEPEALHRVFELIERGLAAHERCRAS